MPSNTAGHTMNIAGLPFPLLVRLGTSDQILLHDIFVRKQYDISLPGGDEPKLIVDGGANVGYSAVFFANKFPNAKIYCFEPEEINYGILERNTSPYPNISTFKAALWNRDDIILSVLDKGLGEWGYVTELSSEPSSSSCKGTSISTILSTSKHDEIDILKLDIEGAEKEVFMDNYTSWLPKVKMLIIEIHDRFKQGCSSSVFHAISEYSFELKIHRDMLVFIRI